MADSVRAGGRAARRARLLTDRERQFCRHFVVSANAAESARKSGYSTAFANRAGYTLLKRQLVMEEIERLKEANRQAVSSTLAVSLSTVDVTMPEVRRQVDAEVAAQLDRCYCIAGLYQSAEIALGRRKVTVSVMRRRTEPGKGEIGVRVSEVEMYKPDPAAANSALEKLAKLLPDAITAEGAGGDVLAPEVAAVIDGFRSVVTRYRERTAAKSAATDLDVTETIRPIGQNDKTSETTVETLGLNEPKRKNDGDGIKGRD